MIMPYLLPDMGHCAMGSRLKRTGLAMQATTQAWLQQQGCDMPSAQMPVLAVLFYKGAVSTGELALALGIAQPGASRLADQMERAGWVRIKAVEHDRRVRKIALTQKGRRLGEQAHHEFWPLIDEAVQTVCASLTGAFLDQLSQLEARIADGTLETEFARRVLERTPS